MADSALTRSPSHFARLTPDKPAVVMAESGESLTFAELEERSCRLAQLLYAEGLRPGDHIALIMENTPRFFEVCWAAQRSGLYFTPVNFHLTAAEAAYVVNDCGAKVLVVSHQVALSAPELVAETSGIARRLITGGEAPGFESYEEAIARYPAVPLAKELEGGSMVYSSGTTGRPKGILMPLAGDPYGTGTLADELLGDLFGFGPDTVYVSPAPLYHAAPLNWTMMAQRLGGTAVCLERFDAATTLETIERHRATIAQFVPTMFVRMLKLPADERSRYDLSSLRVAVHAAAPCPTAVKEQMIAWWGPIVWEYLGASEGGFAMIDSHEWLAHKGSVGKPSFWPAHIVGEDGEELGPGEPGVVYWESLPDLEYHNDPAKSAEVRHRKGWRTVGDIGYLDHEGYLFLTDRLANMIISGGVNIYPQEAENLLIEHPSVMDAAVIGVPNEEFGEEVKAVVQAVDPAGAGPELAAELIAYCRANLAHYKCPRSVDFVDELPRLPTGKLLKRNLKDRYWQGREGRI